MPTCKYQSSYGIGANVTELSQAFECLCETATHNAPTGYIFRQVDIVLIEPLAGLADVK